MGKTKEYKCLQCGNVWQHLSGVGFAGKTLIGSPEDNTTGDADSVIKCPKCGSTDFEEHSSDVHILWD